MGLINNFIDKIKSLFFRNKIKRLNSAQVAYEGGFSQNCKKYIDNDGIIYFDYNAVNPHNGSVVKLRSLSEAVSFDDKSHLYTGIINNVYKKKNKKFRKSREVPVCFITEKRIEDIMQSKNVDEQKQLVDMLSSKKARKSNSNRLNYIGGLDDEGKIIKNINNQGLLVANTVNNLKLQFYKNNQKTNDG